MKSGENQKEKCFLYARSANPKRAEDDNSTEQQIAKCRKFAAMKNLEIVHELSETAGGSRISEKFIHLLELASQSSDQKPHIVVSTACRICRSYSLYTSVISKADSLGVKIFQSDGRRLAPFDEAAYKTFSDRLMSLSREYERQRHGELIKAGLRRKKEAQKR